MVFIVVLMVEWDGGENFSTSVLLFPPECNVGAILRDIIRHRNLILAICVMITFRQPGSIPFAGRIRRNAVIRHEPPTELGGLRRANPPYVVPMAASPGGMRIWTRLSGIRYQ